MSNTGDGKKLATFNIEGEIWDAFKAKAREDGANASALLNQWIKKYLDKLPSDDLGSAQVDEAQSISEESLIERLLPSLTEKVKAAVKSDLGDLINDMMDKNLPTALGEHLGKA